MIEEYLAMDNESKKKWLEREILSNIKSVKSSDMNNLEKLTLIVELNNSLVLLECST